MEGRTALITGGGTGIGAEAAILFAREGARVIVMGRREEPLLETLQKIQDEGNTAYHIIDVANLDSMQSMFTQILNEHGPIDALVNSAGVVYRKESPPTFDIETWQWMVDINLKGVFHTCKFALQHMLNAGSSGTIVNISSVLEAPS